MGLIILFSDSLQRHLLIHGESYKPSPSGRSKRACAACHHSKIKCDGNQRCSKCIKKGIECVYDQSAPDPQVVVSAINVPSNGWDGKERPANLISGELPSIGSDQFSHSVFYGQENRPASTTLMIAAETPTFSSAPVSDLGRNKTTIEWVLESRVEPDPSPPGPQSKSRIHDDNPYPLSNASIERYAELYFSHFHFRWPIIHRPT
jgi:hypothetical protein